MREKNAQKGEIRQKLPYLNLCNKKLPSGFKYSKSWKKRRKLHGHPLKCEWENRYVEDTLKPFLGNGDVSLDKSATSRCEDSPKRRKYLRQLEREGYIHYWSRLNRCGKEYITLYCSNKRGHVLRVPYRCNLRICEHEEGKRYARLKPLLDYVKHDDGYYKLLTLTTGVKVESVTIYNDYRKAIVKFYHRIEKKIDGAIMVTEFTKVGYIHFHFLIRGKRYLSQRWLSGLWKRYTGKFIVDIRKARNKTAVNYILKYMIKAPNLEICHVSVGQFLSVLHGKRLLTTYGCFYGVDFSRKKEPCYCVFCFHATGIKYPMRFGGIELKEGVDVNGT